LVALVYLLVTIVLALLGAAIGTNLINFSGVTLPEVPSGVQQEAPESLGAILTASGILALLPAVRRGSNRRGLGCQDRPQEGRCRSLVDRAKPSTDEGTFTLADLLRFAGVL